VLVRVIVHVAVPMPISRAGPADTLMSLREEPRMTTGVLNTGANSRVYEIFGSAGDRGRLTGNGRSDVHRAEGKLGPLDVAFPGATDYTVRAHHSEH